MENTNNEHTILAVKCFWEGIRKGLSQEEALNQLVFEGKTVSDIFKGDGKISGTLYHDKAIMEIVNFFKDNENAWATRGEIIDFMKDIFDKTEDALWGHIYRMKTNAGLLEYDKTTKRYRLAAKLVNQ